MSVLMFMHFLPYLLLIQVASKVEKHKFLGSILFLSEFGNPGPQLMSLSVVQDTAPFVFVQPSRKNV